MSCMRTLHDCADRFGSRFSSPVAPDHTTQNSARSSFLVHCARDWDSLEGVLPKESARDWGRTKESARDWGRANESARDMSDSFATGTNCRRSRLCSSAS
eukprot:scaffold14984_cov69-Phaeocystis_antarctica.AAC.10